MEPIPENIEFYSANKEIIDERFEDANKERILRGFPVLSQTEMDEGVTAMRNIVDEGGRITQFRFPPLTQPLKVRTPGVLREVVQGNSDQEIGSSRKSFTVIKCENGFILHLRTDAPQTFIFESARKLVGILKKLLFEEKKYERKTRQKVQKGSSTDQVVISDIQEHESGSETL